MKQLAAILGVMTIVVLAAGAAQAYSLAYFAGDAGFFTNDYANAASTYPPQEANWQNPFATSKGAIWINSGGGAAMAPAGSSINMELWVNDYDASWGSAGNGSGGTNGWLLEQRVLVSDGTATGDIMSGYPGTFWTASSQLGVPGTYWQDRDTGGDQMDTSFQFHLYAWTGTATTFAAALAGGAATDDVIWTQNVAPAYYGGIGQTPPIPPGLNNPAMVLEGLSGDANRDGKVDINDLTVVLTNFDFTAGASRVAGDFNGDGKVDINDLTTVLTNFGRSVGASAGGGRAAVPEPGMMMLAATGMVGLLAYAWRKRK